jgi:2-oxoglutarate ferredoxin oxidoreductase subunit gamma
MKTEMICSGFGGQGALTIGKFLAQAGMEEGKNVSWLPSYGPEMRGGTANVSVVIADEEIASPLVSHPDILVALNQPSLDKFGPVTRPNGIIFVNEDMCPRKLKREDVEFIYAPMSTIAGEIGTQKVLNMISIGMIIGKTNLVRYETLETALKDFMANRSADLLKANLEAIRRGIDLVK